MAELSPDLAATESGEVEARPDRSSHEQRWFRLSATYCLLVFLLSWGFCIYAWTISEVEWHLHAGAWDFNISKKWVIAAAGGYAPAAVAILLGFFTRWRYFPTPFAQVRSPILPKSLYAFSIVPPFVILFGSYLFEKNFSTDSYSSYGFLEVLSFALIFVANIPIAPLGEEPGWRGCLQPLLSRRFGLWPASLIVGVIWALWHLPLYLLIYGIPLNSYLLSCVSIMGMSVVLAGLYRAGGNSLRLPILFHASWNASARFLTDAGASFSFRWAAFQAAATWLLALFCWLWWSGRDAYTES
jgi:membrane protease YdiL (CAAX protease family)